MREKVLAARGDLGYTTARFWGYTDVAWDKMTGDQQVERVEAMRVELVALRTQEAQRAAE